MSMGQGLGRAMVKRRQGLCLGPGRRREAAHPKECIWSVEFWSLEVGP